MIHNINKEIRKKEKVARIYKSLIENIIKRKYKNWTTFSFFHFKKMCQIGVFYVRRLCIHPEIRKYYFNINKEIRKFLKM